MGTPTSPEILLRDEFRRHLQVFYSRLKLAPPYHSVEKALLLLAAMVNALPPEEQHRLANEPAGRWTHYQKAFVESGLCQKHRGIIAGLARDRNALDLPKEFDHLLDLYLTRS